MNIAVCIKQVPKNENVRIDPARGTLIRDGEPGVLNPDDASAVEAAVRMGERVGAEITVLTMGPPGAEIALRECLAMGADWAVLLSDRAFAGSDTWATANVLAAAIRKLGPVDLVLTGLRSTDGETGQVGPQVAERLGIAQVTGVDALEPGERGVTLRRRLDDGHAVLEAEAPVLLTISREANRPRYLSIGGILAAYDKPLIRWSMADIGLDPERAGLEASPTRVEQSFSTEEERAGVLWQDGADEMVDRLLGALRERRILRGGEGRRT